jgi:LysE type translocator
MSEVPDPTGGWAKATEATAHASKEAIQAGRDLGRFISAPAGEVVAMLWDHLKVVRFERQVRLAERVPRRSGGLAGVAAQVASGYRGSLARAYSQGLLTDLLNPKLLLFFFSFLSQFVDPARGPPSEPRSARSTARRKKLQLTMISSPASADVGGRHRAERPTARGAAPHLVDRRDDRHTWALPAPRDY